MTPFTLVTGASEGIGRAFAHIAAERGRNVVLAARSEDRLRTLADELNTTHQVEAVVIPADLAAAGGADALWEEATAGREIDVLINNAGLGRSGAFADGGWSQEAQSIAVNVTAATCLAKHAVAHMRDRGGGRILNVGSVAGFMPGPNMAVYYATKAYLLNLSEALAEELRGTRVSVTVLCPGPTESKFADVAGLRGTRLLRFARSMDARAVAEAGWNGAVAGRRIVVPGLANKAFAALPRLSPRALVTRVNHVVMSR